MRPLTTADHPNQVYWAMERSGLSRHGSITDWFPLGVCQRTRAATSTSSMACPFFRINISMASSATTRKPPNLKGISALCAPLSGSSCLRNSPRQTNADFCGCSYPKTGLMIVALLDQQIAYLRNRASRHAAARRPPRQIWTVSKYHRSLCCRLITLRDAIIRRRSFIDRERQ